MKYSQASTVTAAAVSCDGGISVLNHCLSWSKFVNAHLYHFCKWFNIHINHSYSPTVRNFSCNLFCFKDNRLYLMYKLHLCW